MPAGGIIRIYDPGLKDHDLHRALMLWLIDMPPLPYIFKKAVAPYNDPQHARAVEALNPKP